MTIEIFTPDEKELMDFPVALDRHDRAILVQIMNNPKMSNSQIAHKTNLSTVEVYRRRTRGCLAVILIELEQEMLNSTKDLIIAVARDSVEALHRLAQGECDCSEEARSQSDNHQIVCLTPVPYATRRSAAKDLIELLMSRKDTKKEEEEEVWESVVSEVGGIQVKRLGGRVEESPANKFEKEDRESAVQDISSK